MRVSWSPDDAASDPFVYVAVEVPAGAAGLAGLAQLRRPRTDRSARDREHPRPRPVRARLARARDAGVPRLERQRARARSSWGNVSRRLGYLPGPIAPDDGTSSWGCARSPRRGVAIGSRPSRSGTDDPRLTALDSPGVRVRARRDRRSPAAPVAGTTGDGLDPDGATVVAGRPPLPDRPQRRAADRRRRSPASPARPALPSCSSATTTRRATGPSWPRPAPRPRSPSTRPRR